MAPLSAHATVKPGSYHVTNKTCCGWFCHNINLTFIFWLYIRVRFMKKWEIDNLRLSDLKLQYFITDYLNIDFFKVKIG